MHRHHLLLFLYICCFSIIARGQTRPKVWEALPFELNSSVRTFYEDPFQDRVIISGFFWKINSTPVNNAISFDGQTYTKLGGNQDINQAMCITHFEGLYYYGGFGGLFTWDGDTTWTPIQTDLLVNDMKEIDGELVVGGLWSTDSSRPYDGLAVWDHERGTWESFHGFEHIAPSPPRGGSKSIAAIVEYKGEVYVGGNIDNFSPYNEIARWDGNDWKDVGGGVIGSHIDDMIVYKDELYVSGFFYQAGDEPVSHIARWNGQRWDGLGGGIFPSQVSQLFIHDGYLWMVGKFYAAGGIYTGPIARWDGERWCSPGGDFGDIPVTASIGRFRDTLYVGGGFRSVDGDSSIKYIAKLLDHTYVDTCSERVIATQVEDIESPTTYCYPNPVQDQLRIHTQNIPIQSVRLWGLQGVVHEEFKPKQSQYTLSWDVTHLTSGLYIVEIIFPSGKAIEKVWIQ
ncbi:MAG: T9SS type A sorting domain-containing protein [Bacteroidota bacterium]